MKKLLFFFAFTGSYLGLCAQVTPVRLTVQLPAPGILKDSVVFVTGTFNNWNPSDSSAIMKRIDARHYTMLVPCFKNKKYEYKYTLGSWESVEKQTNNNEIDNRQFISYKRLKVNDTIAAWNQPSPDTAAAPKQGLLTPEQLTKLAALKDSLTTQLTPVVPALMGILQKINVNFLSDTPDKKLEKQYRDEIADVFSKALDSLSGLFYNVSEMLTPEQKAKLRKAMKDSKDPKDLINIISKNLAP